MRIRRFARYLAVSGLFATLLLTSVVFAAGSNFTYHATLVLFQIDTYPVTLRTGDNVTATMVCDEVAPGDRPLDPSLFVIAPDNHLVAADDDGFNSSNGGVDCNNFASSVVHFVATTGGIYTFYSEGGASAGPYTLTIAIEPGANPMLSDGRIDGQQAAPIILYCADDRTVLGLSTDGHELFRLANGTPGSGPNWSMGTAPDGRMLLTSVFPDGKSYYFAFPGCPHGHYDALAGNPPTVFDSGSY